MQQTVNQNELYLAWQDRGRSNRWFVIGWLEASPARDQFTFRYTKGALTAMDETGFRPLEGFPGFHAVYRSPELFPVFKNRLHSPNRSDFPAFLEVLDLPPEHRDPMDLMLISGGRRRTDNLEVIPKIEPASEGHFDVRFFLHGLRYHGVEAVEAVDRLSQGERLTLVYERENEGTKRPALRVETLTGVPVGYVPNYLVEEFQTIRELCAYPEEVHVVRNNYSDAPLDHRLLLSLASCWPLGHVPMAGEAFQFVEVKTTALR